MNRISTVFRIAPVESKLKNGQDEYKTLFTRPLNAENNSINCGEIDDQNSILCTEYIGGPIKEENSKSLTNHKFDHDQDIKLNRSIIPTPADSSCGFHNTFSVLEKRLNKSKYHKLSQNQIEDLLNKDIDIPIEYHHSPCSVSGLANSPLNDGDFPSDYESEALNRIRSPRDESASDHANVKIGNIEPLSEPFESSLVETFYQQDDTDGIITSNKYTYHIARARTGQLYIRVRRNLQLDKGKFIYLFYQ